MKTVILFTLSLLLTSCATTRSYENKISKWKGRSSQELISEWGNPTSTVSLSDGGKVLRYQNREKGNQEYEKVLASTGGNANPVFDCSTDILVDAAQTIVGWQFEGPNCRK